MSNLASLAKVACFPFIALCLAATWGVVKREFPFGGDDE